ncbi:MAG: haloacid dehalogenase-like hydrolase, partial [Bacteroidales bacterium]|nr:haloacid dehalogenase-like hydrolase [Bacteroidales bacterium]
MTAKPTVALIYDFDGTLSPRNMQEFDFLKEIGINDKDVFWKEADDLVVKHNASNILCYMKLMIDKSRAAGRSIRRQAFVNYGKSVELYPGVEAWFDEIELLAQKYNVIVEHYINSSGLKEMIEGTKIASKFKQIYACSFMYNVDEIAEWPAVAVDFTTKTQFLFMINKGIANISENYRVNEYKPDEERPIPFKHM